MGILKWITEFLEENIEFWDREEAGRKEEDEKRQEDWQKKTRLAKVAEQELKYKITNISNQKTEKLKKS